MKNKHYCKKLGLTLIALAMSSSIQAKGLLDELINKAVYKIEEALLKDKPVTNATEKSHKNSAEILNINSIPEVFHGTWGWVEGQTNRCQDEDGMGLFVIDAKSIGGYEMQYALKKQIQSLNNGKKFVGQFEDDSGYGSGGTNATLELNLIGTENLRFDAFDGLLVKCSASDKDKREAKSSAENPAQPYNYSDYPASNIYTGKPAKLNLASNKMASLFKTRLSQGLRDGVNFSGSYTVVEWGCGGGCIGGALVDVRTGKVIDLPNDIQEGGVYFDYQKNSSLFVVKPMDDGRENGEPPRFTSKVTYYNWNGNSFIKLN